MEEKNYKAIIKKINQIYKRGYMPSRKRQKYTTKTALMVNCFGHACFNLKNSDLNSLQDLNDDLVSYFRNLSIRGSKYNLFEEAKDRIRQVGLKIEKSSLNEKINNKNQWKIAYYYLHEDYYQYDELWGRDIHFMLQEKNGTWSSKLSTKSEVEIFEELPTIYRNKYELVGVFKITNPYINTKQENEMEF